MATVRSCILCKVFGWLFLRRRLPRRRRCHLLLVLALGGLSLLISVALLRSETGKDKNVVDRRRGPTEGQTKVDKQRSPFDARYVTGSHQGQVLSDHDGNGDDQLAIKTTGLRSQMIPFPIQEADIDATEERLKHMKQLIEPGSFRIEPDANDNEDVTPFFHYRQLAAMQAERQARRRHVCQARQLQTGRTLLPGETAYHEGWMQKGNLYDSVEVYRQQNLFFCPVLKVGSTFFRRLLFALSQGKKISSPYQIPIKIALRSRRDNLINVAWNISYMTRTMVLNREQLRQHVVHLPRYGQGQRSKDMSFSPEGEKLVQEFLSRAGKIMFTREPYAKLLSGYVDKLFAPNPYFWQAIGRVIIHRFRRKASQKSLHCGHDVTFREFIQFVIESETNNKNRDAHFVPTYDRCKPCNFSYDVIGKLETFREDTSLVVAQLGFNLSQSTLDTWSRESEADAIYDSIASPYGWKRRIVRCISWREANQRIWRKLQIRGLVGRNEPLPPSGIHEFSRSPMEFIQLAKVAWQGFRATGLKTKQKKEALSSAYSSVSRRELDLLREYFLLDFDLFGYYSRPAHIFAAKKTWDLFNLSQGGKR